MKVYTVYFTDGRWSFTVEVLAPDKQYAKQEFLSFYPDMYIEDIEIGREV